MAAPSKARKIDPRITSYITEAAPFAKPILRHLRKLVHQACPAATEDLKWGMPAFLYNGKILCGMAAFKAHSALWFWRGSSFIKDSGKAGQAMGNFGRITAVRDLPPAAKLKSYVKQAMQLNELKSRPSRRRQRKP